MMGMMGRKELLTTLLLIVGFLIVAEAIAGLRLFRSVASYKMFWEKTASQSGEFTYLALGDSAAQGIGASRPDNGYVGLLAERVRAKTGKSVRVVNISKSGATVKDALADQLGRIKDYKPDLITIEIGANDVATLNEASFRTEFNQLASQLPAGSFVANMPYFGSRPNSRPKAFRASQIIVEVMAKYPKLQLVDLQTITQHRHSLRGYAADYFHPNDRAYRNWAEAFWKEIEPEL